MKQKELSILLRLVVVLAAAGALFLLWLFLQVFFANRLTGFAFVYAALHALSVVPVLLALWEAWKIFAAIGRNNSFCAANARRLRRISFYALGDTVFYALILAAMLATLGLDAVDARFLFRVFLVLMGGGITTAAAALSHLTLKAAALKDENDLTI